MPLDADTVSFTLTYGGTLVVALLMFIGQLTAVGILLILAGITWLTAYIIQEIAGSFSRPDPNGPGPVRPSFARGRRRRRVRNRLGVGDADTHEACASLADGDVGLRCEVGRRGEAWTDAGPYKSRVGSGPDGLGPGSGTGLGPGNVGSGDPGAGTGDVGSGESGSGPGSGGNGSGSRCGGRVMDCP